MNIRPDTNFLFPTPICRRKIKFKVGSAISMGKHASASFNKHVLAFKMYPAN